MGLDYIRTAQAKGLSDRAVVRNHGLPNSMLPVITIIGLQLGSLLAGAVLTETVFGLAGVGRAVTEAIQSRDYAVVQGVRPGHRGRLPDRQPDRRHLVRLARSADPARVRIGR